MDPLSALSVAAAAVQLLEFGSRLISDVRQIYCSSQGMPSEFVDLSRIAKDLSVMSAEIDAKLHASGLNGSSSNPSMNLEGESEQTLYRLCLECKAIESELQTALGKLQAHGTTRLRLVVDSFMVALKGLLSSKCLADLKERLYQTRNQLTIALLVSFW